MRALTLYEAFDGQRFDSAEACKAHEAAHAEMRLVGLTLEQVRAAMSRDDVELADTFEDFGNRIAKVRRESGDLRRGKKAVAEQEPKPPEPEVAGTPRLSDVLERAKAAGRAAWSEGKGGVVPEIFDTAKPLHDAWLDGWEEGQAEPTRLHDLQSASLSRQTEAA